MIELANKYRPKTFNDVVAQSAIKTILQNQLDTKEYKNAYLFCGGAGTGKTTCARIFANEINGGVGNPIEIDAASNNSVEDIRNIIEMAKTKSLDSEYKIFIMDECFIGDSLITTSNGIKQIKDIVPGDRVATLTGFNEVAYVHKKGIDNSRLKIVKLSDGREIVSTENHLYLTTKGWIECKDLMKGDILLDYKDLSKLWKDFHNEKKGKEILQQQVSDGISKQTQIKGFDNKDLSDMWEYLLCGNSKQSKENLFSGMSEKVNIAIRKDYNEFRVWDGTKEIIITKNETIQPNAKTGMYSKYDCNENIEWNSSSVERETRGQWTIYRASNSAIPEIKRFLGIRITNKDWVQEDKSRTYCYIIQSRPWLQREETCDRSGWQEPQLEKSYCIRYEKDYGSKSVRVESVEIYKPRNNEQHGESSTGNIFVYDLTIKNNPTYFVNGVLVHNCHMLSNSAWNAALKILEEPPVKSIFIFCTTDPQKIPHTILSRVQRFDFQRINKKEIINRLLDIISKEEVSATPESVTYIAELADGGMRDAITMLEKCLIYNNKVTIEIAEECLGRVSHETMNTIVDNIGKDIDKVLSTIDEVYYSGKDIKQLVNELLWYVLNLKKEHSDYPNLTKLLDCLVTLQQEIKWCENPRILLESKLVLLSEVGNGN